MTWVGQIILGAQLVLALGTAAVLFIAVLAAAFELPCPGKFGSASRGLPGRKTTGTRRQRVDLNQTSDPL